MGNFVAFCDLLGVATTGQRCQTLGHVRSRIVPFFPDDDSTSQTEPVRRAMAARFSMIRSVTSPDGALILDVERDRMIRLNYTASRIWLSLQKGAAIEEIAREIAAETGADFNVVCQDVRDFCLQLSSLLPLTF
jgi:Coenzyme PQQ synthesis protein D (PqqD)